MTSSDILALLPIGEKQLRNLINHKGLPCEGKGQRRTFVWADVLEWWVEYRTALAFKDGNGGNDDASDDDDISENGNGGREDIRSAMLRKTRAEADLKQLALSRQRGEVITIGDAKQRLDRVFTNLRAKLLSLAPKLASRLEGIRERTVRESTIADEMANVCQELSTGAILTLPAPTADDDPDTLDDISAAADLPLSPANVVILRGVAELLADYDAL